MAGLLDGFHNFVTGGKLQGLLSDPMFNFGTGMMAASGPSPVPVNFGQALNAGIENMSQRQVQQLRLQATRDQLKDQKDQRDARAQLQGLLSNPASSVPASIRAPNAITNEQSQMQGLLAQAYPEQYGQAMTQGLFAQPEQPRLSTAMNDYMAMTGQQPNSPGFMEGFEKFQQLQDPMAAQQSTLLGLQIANERNEQADRTEAQRVERATLASNTNGDLRSLKKMYELNQILAPTFLATGGVLPKARRDALSVLSNIGIVGEEAVKTIDAWDQFSKEQENLANRVAERYGSNTNARYQGVINSIPNLGLNPAANESVILRMMDDFIGGASDMGIEVRNLDQYRSLMSPAVSSQAPTAQPSTGNIWRFDAQGNRIQ